MEYKKIILGMYLLLYIFSWKKWYCNVDFYRMKLQLLVLFKLELDYGKKEKKKNILECLHYNIKGVCSRDKWYYNVDFNRYKLGLEHKWITSGNILTTILCVFVLGINYTTMLISRLTVCGPVQNGTWVKVN